ncbi:hypothetical protein GN958_ATG11802 [Phytophthora infestans]|uniref:Uncharacterized protein n=1 Tax=Phytophthora infestans TaxID=4787 RepID=A0A8S9UHS2_PHYIN|nr:hypothetical protein GN958_ATG11802 [Phytophthora infestans]
MRYPTFQSGFRKKQMLVMLDVISASDIPEACAWLMFKDMYRLVEEEEESSEDRSIRRRKKTETQLLASVDALTQQMQSCIMQQQQGQGQMMQNRWQGPRSPGNKATMVATTMATPSAGN